MSGAPTQQQTSLTSPVYTSSFSFVLVCLVIIDPVQQGNAQMSHPLCQVSAVPESLCGVEKVLWLAVLWIVLSTWDRKSQPMGSQVHGSRKCPE